MASYFSREIRASDTSRKALSAVCWYWAVACDQLAIACRFRAFRPPAWKIGPTALGAMLQAFVLPEDSSLSGVLNLPKNVVSPIAGKNADCATPIWALAALTL